MQTQIRYYLSKMAIGKDYEQVYFSESDPLIRKNVTINILTT